MVNAALQLSQSIRTGQLSFAHRPAFELQTRGATGNDSP